MSYNLFQLLGPTPRAIIQREIEMLHFRHAFHHLELEYRRPDTDREELGELWDEMRVMHFNPAFESIPDMLARLQNMTWEMEGLGDDDVNKATFIR